MTIKLGHIIPEGGLEIHDQILLLFFYHVEYLRNQPKYFSPKTLKFGRLRDYQLFVLKKKREMY